MNTGSKELTFNPRHVDFHQFPIQQIPKASKLELFSFNTGHMWTYGSGESALRETNPTNTEGVIQI